MFDVNNPKVFKLLGKQKYKYLGTKLCLVMTYLVTLTFPKFKFFFTSHKSEYKIAQILAKFLGASLIQATSC